jgi:hypothetical protein
MHTVYDKKGSARTDWILLVTVSILGIIVFGLISYMTTIRIKYLPAHLHNHPEPSPLVITPSPLER